MTSHRKSYIRRLLLKDGNQTKAGSNLIISDVLVLVMGQQIVVGQIEELM